MAIRPSVIGYHVGWDIKIEFLEKNSSSEGLSIIAKIDEQEIPVSLPRINFPDSRLSLADRIDLVLKNRLLQMNYISQKSVTFQPVPLEQIEWKQSAELNFPEGTIHWICRKNGMISYAIFNTITTWDWKNQQLSSISFQTKGISTFAELSDGRLIVACEEGLFLEGSHQDIPINIGKVDKIIPINPLICVLIAKNEDEGYEAKLLDIKDCSITDTRKFEGDINDISLINGQMMILKPYIFQVNGKKLKKVALEYQRKEIKDIKKVSGTSVLLIPSDEEKPVLLLDLEQNKSNPVSEKSLVKRIRSGKKIFLINQNTLAFDIGNYYIIHNFTKEEPITSDKVGPWSVVCDAVLSNRSIICATDTRNPQIHFISEAGKLVFSSEGFADNKVVKSLVELVGGGVVIGFEGSCKIIQPERKDPTIDNKDYEIEKTKLDLKFDPTNLTLYSKLANLYEEAPENVYQIFLAGLQAAMKKDDLYQARRFYEKARKINPDDELKKEPSLMFLSLLKGTIYSNQITQVALDLVSLEEPPSKFLDFNRNCKKRLLVGEGDFSYTEAVIKKHEKTHPKLPAAMTATELLKPAKGTPVRVLELMKKGVEVLFGVDAQQLHIRFRGKRFKRIHWNCPFGGTSNEERVQFKNVIPEFFKSCAQLQLPKDRVHVTLMQGSADEYWKTRQQENPIVKGATEAGYLLIRKRLFGAERYLGYKHVKTGRSQAYDGGGEEREFVFEKTTSDSKKYDPAQKSFKIEPSDKTVEEQYFVCSSDEDSSDYYESD